MALTITSVAEGTTLTLELDGRLGTLETREFDSAFDEKARGMKQVLLDFSKVEYISSAGLRSLFTANKKINLHLFVVSSEIIGKYAKVLDINEGNIFKLAIFFIILQIKSHNMAFFLII